MRKAIAFLFLAVLLPFAASAQPTAGTGTFLAQDSCTTCSQGNFTLAANSNRIVFIHVESFRFGMSPAVPNSVTVGGVSASLLQSLTQSASFTQRVDDYYILESNLPANGARSVVITYPAQQDYVAVTVFQLNGVKQAAPADTDGSIGSTGVSAANLTLTTTADNSIAIHLIEMLVARTVSFNSPQSSIMNNIDGCCTTATSYAVDAVAGSFNVGVTWSGGNSAAWIQTAYAFEPYVDVTPPVPGDSGTITTSNVTTSGFDAACMVGTDTDTDQANLQYEFRQNNTNNMGSVADAESNGSIIRAYTANDCTHTVTGLDPNEAVWIQVIVKDEAGNKAIYTQKSETTLADATGLPVITVIQPFPISTPPTPTLTITNASPLPSAQETIAYSVTMTAIGGTSPYVWRVEPNSGDLNGFESGGGSLDYHETFSEPAPCSLDNAWVSTTGFTVVSTSPLGSRCVGAKAAGATATAQTGLSLNRRSIKVIDFHRTGTSANTIIGMLNSAAALIGWIEVRPNGDIQVSAGGAPITITSVGSGATFTVEIDCELIGTVVCRGSVNDGAWFTATGTSTSQIGGWRLGNGPDTGTQYYGEIKGCNSGPVDIACAGSDFWVRTGTPKPNNVYINGVQLLETEWDWDPANGGTLSVASVGDPDSDTVEAGYLPEGLSLSAAGVLEGTPAVGTEASSPYTFSLRVIDLNLLTGVKSFSLTIAPEPAPAPTDPEPWVSMFTPTRTHYFSTSGSCGAAGTIGDPECALNAFNPSHYQCGDLHIGRAGTYNLSGSFAEGYIRPTRVCPGNNPAVVKGFVDSSGQPERVLFSPAHFRPGSPGSGFWFVGLEFNANDTSNVATPMNIRGSEIRVINSLFRDTTRTGIEAWNTGPGQVIYGNIVYHVGCVNDQLDHTTYTQNNYASFGYKYYVQNMFMETGVGGCGGYLFHAYAGSAQPESPVSGYWLQDNLMAIGQTATGAVLWSHDANVPSTNNVIRRNYFVDFRMACCPEYGFRMGRLTRWTGEVTNNYFARTVVTPEGYWGANEAHEPTNFQNNEVYDPVNGLHIGLFTTRAASGALGSHKIQNADVWNHNTYGGAAFRGQLFCNGVNSGTLTSLAAWTTATNNCRVTPGSAGFDINSTMVANPTTNKVVVLKNEYQCPSGCPFNDQARGNIYIVNWSGTTSNITVDISSVVGTGKTYTVRYARDFFGTLAASGTCPGSGACNVALPPKRSTSESAGVFVLTYVITGQP